MHQTQAMSICLKPGQTQGVLAEAGSMVYVTQGRLTVSGPVVWQDGMPLPRVQRLCCEEQLLLDDGGWLALSAESTAAALILPPAQAHLGQRITRWLTALTSPKTVKHRPAP